jgi:hypothetical protein
MRRKVEAMFEMPKRLPTDGGVSVTVEGEDHLRIEVTTFGDAMSIKASRYNAARMLVMLCLMLEVPAPKTLGKLPM